MNVQATTVRHILPKANQIVDTAQQDFKSIYSFKLKKTKHIQCSQKIQIIKNIEQSLKEDIIKQNELNNINNHNKRQNINNNNKNIHIQKSKLISNTQTTSHFPSQQFNPNNNNNIKPIILTEYKKQSITIQNQFYPLKKSVRQHFQQKYIIYNKFNNQDQQMFNTNVYSIEKLKNLKNNDFIIHKQLCQQNQNQEEQIENGQNIKQIPQSQHKYKLISNINLSKSSYIQPLIFNSKFQCGNLSLVSKIQGQYFLLLHNDINTSGYTNWFYYSVKVKKPGKYKFAILNFGKAGWPFNQGIGICTKIKGQWKRAGQNVLCSANWKIFRDATNFGINLKQQSAQMSSQKQKFNLFSQKQKYEFASQKQKQKFKRFNTLSFQFEFTQEDINQEIYFSYNIPYSYTDLLTMLDSIERQNYPYYQRKLAGTTLCGNRIQMLTIGNFAKSKVTNAGIEEKQSNQSNIHDNQPQQQQAIILLARSHPGQTISSWILHYFLKFILSSSPEAISLRSQFIFKIFPMLNPDGVIHGNYRCSLIGRDLNRRWNKATKQLYPEVYYVKNQILEFSQKKQIRMIIDLHGHTQKRQAFFFGCNDKNQPHKCRLFPYLLAKLGSNNAGNIQSTNSVSTPSYSVHSNNSSNIPSSLAFPSLSLTSSPFDFSSCNFYLDKSKLSTARITLFMLLKNCQVFTLQTSQFGMKDNVNNFHIMKNIGQLLAKGIYYYFKCNKININFNGQQGINTKQQSKRVKTNKRIDPDQQKIENQEKLTANQQQNQISIQTNPIKNTDNNFDIDIDFIEKQILQSNNLLKSGLQKDDGSDSQPSQCNINFQNLKKLCNRKQLRINSSKNNEQNNKDKKYNSKGYGNNKANANRILISQQKKLQENKKSIDYLAISDKDKILPFPKRFASTSHSIRKNSQDSSSQFHNLTKIGGRLNMTSSLNSQNPNSKIQSQRGISSPSFISKNRKNNPQQLVKMINFQLSFQGYDSQREKAKRKLRSTVANFINSNNLQNLGNNLGLTTNAIISTNSNLTLNSLKSNSVMDTDLISNILDVKLNNFINYTQPSLNRPYSYLHKSKQVRSKK